LNARKRMMLDCCDKIVSVSSFTKNKIIELHHLSTDKCLVLNNCIDPYLIKPTEKKRSKYLIERYNIKETDSVLLTLTRLSARDRYKGYNFVLEAVGEIIKTNKSIKYLLAGGSEPSEKIYIHNLIEKYKLQNHVILTGFIADEEIADHFSLADIYVMPSIKEGFGIVFVEAMYYGVPVIATNADGSSDALLHGKLGLLTEPESTSAVKEALLKMIADHDNYLPSHALLMENFGYESYKRKLAYILNAEKEVV
jgi:phosphatidyl-myo-inositol dimannoside synthase